MAGLALALAAASFTIGHGALAGSPDGDTTGVEIEEGTASGDAPLLLPVPEAPPLQASVGMEQPGSGTSSRQIVDDRAAPSAIRSLEAGCRDSDDPVTITAPATDLAQQVAAAEPGTCFVLQPGEYRFSDVEPKDSMTFLGTSRSEVVVRGDDSTENAFHGTADGVTIGRMRLVGFQGDGGTKPQEQAPIRGTPALWESDRGRLATDWLIEDIESSGNTAAGVFLGDEFTVRGSLLADNGVTGLGGSEIVGGLIEENVIRGNGTSAASGAFSNGAGIKFTEAIAGATPVTVRFNEIYENHKIGVWCDIACDGFHVLGNYIHDQESRAVMYELSRDAVIRDNIMINANTWTDYRRDFNAAAITIGESAWVTVENNYVEGAEAGIVVRQTKRPINESESFLRDYENVTYRSENIEIRSNVLVDVDSMGVSLGATGREVAPDLSTVVFAGNGYASPDGVQFWVDADPVGFGAWQAAGRDQVSPSVVPDRPTWIELDS
jgi:hypothetical protein